MRAGRLELEILWTVIRLGENAYGVPIADELESRGGRRLSVGALYGTLDRLEGKGLLASRFGDPTPERGGRAKRYFRVTADGKRVAQEGREALEGVWRRVRLRPQEA